MPSPPGKSTQLEHSTLDVVVERESWFPRGWITPSHLSNERTPRHQSYGGHPRRYASLNTVVASTHIAPPFGCSHDEENRQTHGARTDVRKYVPPTTVRLKHQQIGQAPQAAKQEGERVEGSMESLRFRPSAARLSLRILHISSQRPGPLLLPER